MLLNERARRELQRPRPVLTGHQRLHRAGQPLMQLIELRVPRSPRFLHHSHRLTSLRWGRSGGQEQPCDREVRREHHEGEGTGQGGATKTAQVRAKPGESLPVYLPNDGTDRADVDGRDIGSVHE